MRKKLQRLATCLLAGAACACVLSGCGQEPEEDSLWISMKEKTDEETGIDDSTDSMPEPESNTDGVPEPESGAGSVPEQGGSGIKEETDNVGDIISSDRNAIAENGTTGTDLFRSILLGDSEFISKDLGNQSISIGEIGQVVTDDPGITVSADRFTIIDLNGDGENEIVLWIQINGASDYGFEVLYDQGGVIYGSMLVYREFMNLKTDGTFLFSSGAADSGIGRLSFSEAGYTVDAQAQSESQFNSDNEFNIQYYVNSELCSEAEFNAAMSNQEQKPDVEWYDLSVHSVNAAF